MNVLLLEPDKVLANNYQAIFSAQGLTCEVFFDPQLAVEKMDTRVPDIIVMEVQLAPISGIAFLHELIGYEDFSQIPVVIYSSIPKESHNIDDKSWAQLGVVKYYYKSKYSAQKVASFVAGYLK